MTLNHKTIAILTADDGIERVELAEPRRALEREGARVGHITPSGGRARTFEQNRARRARERRHDDREL